MTDEFINQKEIRVIGVKRNGHHAIINWIFQQCSGKKCFINDVKTNRNPFKTCNAYNEITDRKQEVEGVHVKKDLLIYSYEDKFLGDVYNNNFEEQKESFIGKSKKIFNIIVLRDPFNNFASRLKSNRKGAKWAWGEENKINMLRYISLWENHAEEYLNITNYMGQNKIIINYNKWCKNIDYRKNIATSLNIQFTDKGFKEVPKAGGGSAFDGRKYDNKANEMKTEERWKEFINDEYYVNLFDDNIIELFQKIWSKNNFPELYKINIKKTNINNKKIITLSSSSKKNNIISQNKTNIIESYEIIENMKEKKATICVLLYGDYLNLAKRCIDSIIKYCNKDQYILRIGLNQCSQETINYVLSIKEIDDIYISKQNINKCPMMRRMFKDIYTKYIWWFDDDCYITEKTALEKRINIAENDDPNIVMWGRMRYLGRNHSLLYQPLFKEWIKKQKWYSGKEPPCGVNDYIPEYNKSQGNDYKWFFITGPNWFLKTSIIKEFDWPSQDMIKQFDDVLWGIFIRQIGYKFRNIQTPGIEIGHPPRRGCGYNNETLQYLLNNP